MVNVVKVTGLLVVVNKVKVNVVKETGLVEVFNVVKVTGLVFVVIDVK